MAMQVRPLSFALGAEVIGIDLTASIDAATAKQLRELWLEHSVLLFRGQILSPQQQIAFSRGFGELDRHEALIHYRHPEFPEIFVVSNRKVDGKMSETKDTGREWHIDLSFTLHPSMGSLLHCVEIPPAGGTTLWASMYAAYDALSPKLQSVLEGLSAVHDISIARGFTRHAPEIVADMRKRNPPVVQPMIRIHEESGRKALYMTEWIRCFDGMTEDESQPILKMLLEHATRPEFNYRHTWKPGDLIMWDNRCTMHLAPPDYRHATTRHMHRTTLLGSPSGHIYAEE